jgi:hypothetical protein
MLAQVPTNKHARYLYLTKGVKKQACRGRPSRLYEKAIGEATSRGGIVTQMRRNNLGSRWLLLPAQCASSWCSRRSDELKCSSGRIYVSRNSSSCRYRVDIAKELKRSWILGENRGGNICAAKAISASEFRNHARCRFAGWQRGGTGRANNEYITVHGGGRPLYGGPKLYAVCGGTALPVDYRCGQSKGDIDAIR